jgi:anoctamin-10
MPEDGGLGITPGSADWDMVESILALHDKKFNESWVRHWSPRELVSVELEKIRAQV